MHDPEKSLPRVWIAGVVRLSESVPNALTGARRDCEQALPSIRMSNSLTVIARSHFAVIASEATQSMSQQAEIWIASAFAH